MIKEQKYWYDRTDITPREIAKLVTWEEVLAALRYNYPFKKTRWQNYKKVFYFVMHAKKMKPPVVDEFLEAKVGGDRLLDEGMLDEHHHLATNKYSLSFRPWRECANIPVSKDTLWHVRYRDIMAHFIYEITWYGNEKQMNAKGRSIKEAAKKCQADIKKGKNAFRPL